MTTEHQHLWKERDNENRSGRDVLARVLQTDFSIQITTCRGPVSRGRLFSNRASLERQLGRNSNQLGRYVSYSSLDRSISFYHVFLIEFSSLAIPPNESESRVGVGNQPERELRRESSCWLAGCFLSRREKKEKQKNQQLLFFRATKLHACTPRVSLSSS